MARALPAVVYHMAEVENWPSIQRHGLLSASALLDLAGLKGSDRVPHESHKRPGHSLLPGGIVLRDQNPMPPDALARVLVGMTPTEWYRLMNARVFLCLDLVRLNGLRRACGDRPQIILCLDSARLVQGHAGRMTLSPINSGYARRAAARRGRATWVPYADWVARGWAAEAEGLGSRPRSASHAPAELAVEGGVPDVMACLIEARPLAVGEEFVEKSRARRRSRQRSTE
jgi:hypothetical protein